MSYLEAKRARKMALLRLLGIESQATPEEASDPDRPDFDGGVREPTPPPSNAHAEHNAAILELIHNTPRGDGS